MEKLLTVIVPTYNMEKYLDRCLTSLIVDDVDLLDKLEVLVINDGSRDKSSEIAHSYSEKYPSTFKVIDKKNGHYGSCVNRGLKEARGKFIKILDADDAFDTGNFRIFLGFLEKTEADSILTDWLIIGSYGRRQIIKPDLPRQEYFLLEHIVEHSVIVMMHNVCYLTSNVRSVNYSQTEGIPYTDTEWCGLPMSISNKVAYFDKVVYMYSDGRENQSTSDANFRKDYVMFITVFNKLQAAREYVNTLSIKASSMYMDSLIERYILQIYYFHIVRCANENYNDLVISLDRKFMQESGEKYLMMNDTVRVLKLFRYLKIWRKDYSLSSCSLKTIRLCYKIRCRLPEFACIILMKIFKRKDF